MIRTPCIFSGAITRNEVIEALSNASGTVMTHISCIGAPVFDVNEKVVAGLGVTGMTSRPTPERRRRHERHVLKYAESVSRDIGYEGNLFEKIKKQKESCIQTR